jgi:hypothetical protein
MKNAVFWDVAQCSSCVNRRFGGTYRLHLKGRKISERGTNTSRWLKKKMSADYLYPPAHVGSSLADFSTLKFEAIHSSKTSVHTRSTRRHIPEDGILHSHHCENLKSYILILFSHHRLQSSHFPSSFSDENTACSFSLRRLINCSNVN